MHSNAKITNEYPNGANICCSPTKKVLICISEFLISFEAWAKLGQQWLVRVPKGIHLEPIN